MLVHCKGLPGASGYPGARKGPINFGSTACVRTAAMAESQPKAIEAILEAAKKAFDPGAAEASRDALSRQYEDTIARCVMAPPEPNDGAQADQRRQHRDVDPAACS